MCAFERSKKGMEFKMNNKTDWLTSLRGIACLIVVGVHILASIPEVGLNVSGCGKIGVWLFFILSALLLTLQWIKEDKVNIKNVLKFYIKRFFRIYPCYIIVLLCAVIIGYFEDSKCLFTHLFLLEGKGHFWTIPVEFIFYLIIPAIVVLLKKIKRTKLKILCLVVLGIVFENFFPFFLCPENSTCLVWYMPVFLMGMILAYFFKYYENNPFKTIKGDIVFVTMVFAMILSIPFFRKLIFNIEPDGYLQNKFLFFGLIWSVSVIAIQNSKFIKDYLNKSKIFIKLGNISFPIYLVHYILIAKIKFSSQLLNIAIVITLSIILSVILNKLIEGPMIKMSKKIIKKIDNNK